MNIFIHVSVESILNLVTTTIIMQVSFAVAAGKAKWEDLVKPSDFFHKYKYYVQVRRNDFL